MVQEVGGARGRDSKIKVNQLFETVHIKDQNNNRKVCMIRCVNVEGARTQFCDGLFHLPTPAGKWRRYV